MRRRRRSPAAAAGEGAGRTRRCRRRRRRRGVPAIAVDGREEAALPAAEGDTAAAAMVAAKEVAPAAERDAAAVAEGDAAATAVDGEGEALRGIPVAGGGKDEAPAVEGADAIAAEGDEEEEGVKWLKHYCSTQSILTVGDGDFSFSRALATAFGTGENLVATSLDTIEDLRRKYKEAESNVIELKRMGATVLHGINAKRMKNHTDLKMRRFDRIVYNFPHAGFKGKENDLHMINSHKELVWCFFQNARHLLRPYGEIHVNHKIGNPYDLWDIEHLALESSLVMVGKFIFKKEDYPGYNQKRGDGSKCDKPFDLGACRIFMFCIKNLRKLKKVHGNRIGPLSSLGTKIHPDILATDRGSFYLRPLVPASAQPHITPPDGPVQRTVALEPYPFGVAHRQQPSFEVNFGSRESAPYLDQQFAIRPMFSMPPPSLDVLPALDSISRITRTSFRAPQEQPWCQDRPIVEPGRADYHYFCQEDPGNLQEYEMQRQVMPGGTSLGYSAFLEHSFWESVQKEEHLRRMVAWYGRQVMDR